MAASATMASETVLVNAAQSAVELDGVIATGVISLTTISTYPMPSSCSFAQHSFHLKPAN